MQDVMNLEQLAGYLQMSRAAVYHLVAAGKIPGTKVGKQWRFHRRLIDKWLEGTEKRHVAVLVVEDDPLIRELVTKAMREAGHQVTAADSVESAKSFLQGIQFDILLLDLMLPDGTGYDLVKIAQTLHPPPEIVIATGHPHHTLIADIRAIHPGVTVMGKPVKLKTLLERVERTGKIKRHSKNNPHSNPQSQDT
ncbi:MAG: helix-turn-helix domain-containing protein [Armatimonadota bacterium]